MPPGTPLTRLRDRLLQSRFFTLSLTLHIILVAVLGTTVLIKLQPQPPDMVSDGPLVARQDGPVPPPRDQPILPDVRFPLNPATTIVHPLLPPVVTAPLAPQLNPEVLILSSPSLGQIAQPSSAAPGASRADRQRIEQFTQWTTGSSTGQALTQRSFAFTAFLGRYRDGNWQSSVKLSQGEITGGSLPNLLYVMSKWSKDKIKTDERAVRSIALDSPELLASRPPFVFLTGTRDFHLTEAEVQNLRTYLRSGGAVWGDSSVPGQRSAFDLAFRREMKRVLPDLDKDFEPLPDSHVIFTAGYYPQVRETPAGINHYREPVQVLRYLGEIAVIHTRNDYGDMWQFGLDRSGQIDTRTNERGEFVALNPSLWAHRGLYVRNVEQPAVEQAFRFGINVVVHLLTRWETRFSPGTPL